MVHYVFGNAATTSRHSAAHGEEPDLIARRSAHVGPRPRNLIRQGLESESEREQGFQDIVAS